jgi:NAD(P)-dependent dehydrogenase (short-subunit alcohol dehydrogenase family)
MMSKNKTENQSPPAGKPQVNPKLVVLITGASIRLGRAMALRLARGGASLAVHYNSSKGPAEETLGELRALGAEAHLFQADLTESGAPQRLFDEVVAQFGHVDVVINNASVYYPVPLEEVTEEQFDHLMTANAKSPFFLARAFAVWCRENNQRGHLINMLDASLRKPSEKYLAYSMGKAALLNLTEGMALSCAPTMRVNGIAPGPVLPPDDYSPEQLEKSQNRTPLKEWGSPEDIAAAANYLVFEASYLTGEVIHVDGGRHLN